ncbi:hypothetical protein LX97_02187 [Nonlabens dokdonensis]|uniref:Lipoprotein n=2 Tax=Nonlabens dokdonensis TaxID=328515 RepID=L7WBZ6_NONDD|nr:hypothetical protein [Nonlabens dokdonensis]AGC77624.1 hypothetical protein DDD_2497 [Nonlabens dokdonensis DSW-6]PZX39829.1 hypothetical protein LX97_02187 [Nonlabens dokdonensis]
MKYIVTALLCFITLVLISSCRNDFEFSASTGDLKFSQDTIYLDTVFSTIGSSTRTFKVYNNSSDDIVIPRVALAQGTNSKYRISVDGVPGQVFEDVELLAKDSMFVFVETTVDIMDFTSDTEFLYEDTIEFDSGGNLQKVELVTLIQDAVFLFPERDAMGIQETILLDTDPDGNELRISGFFLDDNELRFTNEKPYVIYGFAGVPSNKTLTIDPGARIHFHSQSGIIVADEATLKVNGALSMTEELENEVIFEGDRLEPTYDDVAGQWAAIWLTSGSKDHEINYATIKNASVGIIMDNNNPTSNGATLKINNSQILNCSNSALIGTTASIEASNSIFHNSGQSTVVGRFGGEYNFNNCTISNYWNGSFRQDATLFISNAIPNTDFTADLLAANFTNCIIYGDRNIELGLLDDGISAFNFKFENSLIRFNDFSNNFDGLPDYDFNNVNLYQECVFNVDPQFDDVDAFKLRIDNTGGANGIANPTTDTALDISGATRDLVDPDAGAFESTDLSGE